MDVSFFLLFSAENPQQSRSDQQYGSDQNQLAFIADKSKDKVIVCFGENHLFHGYKPPFCERHRRGYETYGLSHNFKICYNILGEFGILQNPWR